MSKNQGPLKFMPSGSPKLLLHGYIEKKKEEAEEIRANTWCGAQGTTMDAGTNEKTHTILLE